MNCLIGYGAHAVHPYLLWRAVRHHYELPKSTKMRKDGTLPDISLENAYTNTRSALEAPHPHPNPSPNPNPNPNHNPNPNLDPNPNPNPPTLEVWVAADMVAGKKRAPFRTNRI